MAVAATLPAEVEGVRLGPAPLQAGDAAHTSATDLMKAHHRERGISRQGGGIRDMGGEGEGGSGMNGKIISSTVDELRGEGVEGATAARTPFSMRGEMLAMGIVGADSRSARSMVVGARGGAADARMSPSTRGGVMLGGETLVRVGIAGCGDTRMTRM